MKITDTGLTLASSRQAEVKQVDKESLRVWQDGAETTESETQGAAVGLLRQRAGSLLLNPPAPPVETRVLSSEVTLSRAVEVGEESLDKMHSLEISLLKLLVERFTGREIQVTIPEDLTPTRSDSAALESPAVTQTETTRAGWGLVYTRYQSHFESEQTRFQAQGVVKTADGHEIAVDIQLNMSREFFAETSTTLRAGDALKDPLVINFSGKAAELTRERFEFDIDADGSADQVRFLSSDSGFLALDRNGDGAINDGSELFGALSGNGFADLARFDDDGNGWIDEGDAIFDSLRVWSRDAQGGDQLVALGVRGVGALYLGHIATPFEMKSGDNQLEGVVRQTGLYLQEDGGSGTLQQIDLVV
ncbi:MAG: hypothetical protein KZQ93_20405 [Candidatus Thiodiazotropha sp. (ex Monitilora ramsayi)]|nr:hypothetical protein [Candidatus Thiodiazotropha sp. (ex Monitilora ramsayi)]